MKPLRACTKSPANRTAARTPCARLVVLNEVRNLPESGLLARAEALRALGESRRRAEALRVRRCFASLRMTNGVIPRLVVGRHRRWGLFVHAPTRRGSLARASVLLIVCASLPAWAEDAEPSGTSTFLSGAEPVIEGASQSEAVAEPTEETGEPLALTVERCVELALSQNARVFIAEAKVAAVRAKVGQAEAGRRPRISARSAYTYMDGLETDIGGAGLLGSLLPMKELQGSKDTQTIEVNTTQVLYAGGQITSAVRASQYLAKSEEWRREAALDTLAFEARRAYYDCLLSKALGRVAEDSVVTFERHLSDAQQSFDVGLIGSFEVLRAKTELGVRQSDTIAATNAERLALVNLRRLLAIPQSTPIVFEGKLDWVPLERPVSELVAEALTQRPEVRALEQAIAAGSENVVRMKGQYRPKVAAGAKWSQSEGTGKMYPDGWTFNVGAEWELYAGGRRKHEVAQAEAELQDLEYQLEDVKQLVELDVRQAYIQVRDAIATIRREKGTVELGLEGRRLAMLRFHEGVGTQAETLDAELVLTKAETSLVQALRNYAVARAALEKALGKRTVQGAQAACEPAK